MRNFCLICFLMLGIAYSSAVIALDMPLNSVSITADSLTGIPSCLNFKVVGACIRIVCDVTCHPMTVPKIQEYLPDLVVTVYPSAGHDPWLEMNTTVDVADKAAGDAQFVLTDGMSPKDGDSSTVNNQDDDLQLREVDVIGNPALAVFSFLIRGQATPLMPYYQSQLDAPAWRSDLLEALYPQSWDPVTNEIGTFLVNDWGSLYPRSGFLIQPNIAKASAVIAVRGANIATTESFNHESIDLAKQPCKDQECQTPGEITVDSKKVKWQRIYPDSPGRCTNKISDGDSKWTENNSDQQSFSWVVWRQYTACMD